MKSDFDLPLFSRPREPQLPKEPQAAETPAPPKHLTVTELTTQGSPLLVAMVCVLTAVLGVALGLFFSAFAETEFQAVQFAPIVLVPQLFLAGVFIPRDEMPGWLHSFSDVLPLTYVVDALQQISANSEATSQMWRDISVVVAVIVAAVLGGAATLRRQEA